MMSNIFNSNAKTFGSLMVSPTLQKNGSTQVQSGSIHRKRRIWIATWDTTESFVLLSDRMEQTLGRIIMGGGVERPKMASLHLIRSNPPPKLKNNLTTMARVSRTTICTIISFKSATRL